MRYILIFLLISVSVLVARSQQTFTVSEAITYGLNHQIRLENADLDIRNAEKRLRELLGVGFPHLSGEGQYQQFLKIPTTLVPAKFFNPNAPEDAFAELRFGTEYKLNGGATLSQLLFSGSYLVGLEASRAFVNSTRIMKEKTIQEIHHDIGKAYYSVLMIANNIAILKEQIELTKNLQRETSVLLDNGLIEKTGTRQLDLTILKLTDARAAMQGQYKAAKVLLKFQMGYPLDEEIYLTDDLQEKSLQLRTIVPDSIPSFALTPEMRILANQALLQRLNVKNAKTGYWPTLSAFINYSSSAQRNAFDFFDREGKWFPTSVWGLNLSVPLYDGGMTRAKIAQARIAHQKVINNKQLVDQSLRLKWTQALETFRSAVSSFDRKMEAERIARELYESAEIKYKEGIMSSIELDQTSTQWITARGDLMMARYKLVEAKMELDYLLNQQ